MKPQKEIKERKQEMKYQDNKWSIIYDEKGGLKVYLECNCGNRHDIHLGTTGKFIGRGTLLKTKEE